MYKEHCKQPNDIRKHKVSVTAQNKYCHLFFSVTTISVIPTISSVFL